MVKLDDFESYKEYISWLEKYAEKHSIQMKRVDDVNYYVNFFIGKRTPTVGMSSNIPWGNMVLYSVYVDYDELDKRDMYAFTIGLLSAFMVRDNMEGIRIISNGDHDSMVFELTSISYSYMFARHRYPELSGVIGEMLDSMISDLRLVNILNNDMYRSLVKYGERIRERMREVMDKAKPFHVIADEILPIINKETLSRYRTKHIVMEKIVDGKDLHILVIEPVEEKVDGGVYM